MCQLTRLAAKMTKLRRGAPLRSGRRLPYRLVNGMRRFLSPEYSCIIQRNS